MVIFVVDGMRRSTFIDDNEPDVRGPRPRADYVLKRACNDGFFGRYQGLTFENIENGHMQLNYPCSSFSRVKTVYVCLLHAASNMPVYYSL